MTWVIYVKITFVILLIILLESSFLSVLVPAIPLNLVFCFSLALLSKKRKESALYSALIGGLLMDFMLSSLIGLTPVFLISFLLIISYIKSHLIDNFILYLMSVFVFSFLWRVLFLGDVSCSIFLLFVSNYVVFLIFTYLINKFGGNYESESF